MKTQKVKFEGNCFTDVIFSHAHTDGGNAEENYLELWFSQFGTAEVDEKNGRVKIHFFGEIEAHYFLEFCKQFVKINEPEPDACSYLKIITPTQCKHCGAGADLHAEDGSEFVFCVTCGAKYVLLK